MSHAAKLVADALAKQEAERLTGFTSKNDPLYQLMRLAPEDLIGIVRGLLNGAKAERELAARLLGSETLSGEAVRAEVDAISRSELDPEITSWLVGALGIPETPPPCR